MTKKLINYFAAYIIIVVIACIAMVVYPKPELHLMLNSHHNRIADIFFQYYTILAEWPLYVIAAIPLFFKKWRWTVAYALMEGIAAIVIYLFKHFYHPLRPSLLFKELHLQLPAVPGVHLHDRDSFPSGHSSTFFLFFTFAVLLLANYYASHKDELGPVFKKPVVQQTVILGLLLIALLGCYSRIYLSQHFLIDVTAGSLIGITIPCLTFYFFHKWITK